MSSTPEYAAGATTLVAVIRDLEAAGYTGQMAAAEGGTIHCFTCRKERPAADYELASQRRTEGASDPADEALIAALVCPSCGARGTAVLKFGPEATPEDAEVLRTLEQAGDERADDPADAG